MSYNIPLGVYKYTQHNFYRQFDNKTSIIVFEEKYGKRYFVTHTVEESAEVFYKILKERVDAGYWYNFEDEVGEVQGKFGVFKDKVTQEIYYKATGDVTKLKSEKELMEELLNSYSVDPLKAGIRAYQFLNDLQDGEYESFEVERSEKIKQ